MATPSEVLEVLAAIERGEVTVVPDELPYWYYCGDLRYIASNGWEFWIFNDCGDWDYIDSFKAPGEEVFDPWPEYESADAGAPCKTPKREWEPVRYYAPPDEATDTAWWWALRYSEMGEKSEQARNREFAKFVKEREGR